MRRSTTQALLKALTQAYLYRKRAQEARTIRWKHGNEPRPAPMRAIGDRRPVRTARAPLSGPGSFLMQYLRAHQVWVASNFHNFFGRGARSLLFPPIGAIRADQHPPYDRRNSSRQP